MVKNLPANAGDTGSIPGSERSPGEGNGKLLQYSCLENFHGQRSLAGYSPCGCKGLNTTEHTRTRSPGSITWLCVCSALSHVVFFAILWTVACQAPLCMEFSRQESWSGLPFPSPGGCPNPGIGLGSPASQADPLPSKPPGKPINLGPECNQQDLMPAVSLPLYNEDESVGLQDHLSPCV